MTHISSIAAQMTPQFRHSLFTNLPTGTGGWWVGPSLGGWPISRPEQTFIVLAEHVTLFKTHARPYRRTTKGRHMTRSLAGLNE
ncbi:unnamed protein product [Protopolystoma xenopodis]|uniref:Uncharacterized protein n=1 Tax=Protopolystoma xenopodis TaxID=117903 RepID=A0A3S5AYG2_9PLAT|nr:unnamed protein product [Protopolystoma xenopodis]